MAYNRNQPSPTQLISAGQGTILGNFQAIDTGVSGDPSSVGFSRNHYTMTDATNGGFHYAVTFPSPPGTLPTVTGTQSSVYPKLVDAAQQLFFANAAGSQQISAAPVSSGGLTTVQLAGGLKITYSGVVSFSSGGTPFTFPTAYTTAPSIIAMPEGASASGVTLAAISTPSGFTGYSSNVSANCYVVAVGI